MSAPLLNDREKEILNDVVEVWDERGNAALQGNISYAELFALLDKLGLQRPARLSAFIESVDKKPGKKQ